MVAGTKIESGAQLVTFFKINLPMYSQCLQVKLQEGTEQLTGPVGGTGLMSTGLGGRPKLTTRPRGGTGILAFTLEEWPKLTPGSGGSTGI